MKRLQAYPMRYLTGNAMFSSARQWQDGAFLVVWYHFWSYVRIAVHNGSSLQLTLAFPETTEFEARYGYLSLLVIS
jgi:hypothetical protein